MTKEEFELEASKLQTRREEAKKVEPRHYGSGPLHSYQSDRNRLGAEIASHASDWMARHSPRPLQFDEVDLMDALPDAFALRAGLPLRHAVHPYTTWVSELSFQRIAEQLHVRSLSSSELGAAMSHGFARVVTTVYDSNDNAGPCVLDVVVPDFRPTDFPKPDLIDLQEVSRTGTPEGGNIPLQILNLSNSETGSVNTYRARVLVSRQLILSDSFNLVSSLLQQLASQGGRLPMQEIGRIIGSNSNLSDNQPLLGSSNTAAAGVNLTGLGSAAALLRLGNSDANNVLNLTPSVLLTRPENEISWRAVLKTIELAGQPNILLVVNPWLPTASYSYLVASPTESAVFVRMVFAKPLKPSITSGQLPLEYDGIYLDFSLDFGIKAVSRHGIVRIPSS